MQLRFAAAAQRGGSGRERAFDISSSFIVALTLRCAAAARYSSRIIHKPTVGFRHGRAVITLSVAKRHVVSAHAHSWILHPAFATIIAVHLQRAR